MKEINKELFINSGRRGGLQKGINYRKYLIDELSKKCTKGELNFYMAQDLSNRALQEILLTKQK